MMNPCGIAGGDAEPGKKGNGGTPPPGYKQGFAGNQLPELSQKRSWKVGEVVDIAWAINANHGGGYQYRLCPKTDSPTEECFQKTPIEFVGDEQYIQYCTYPRQYWPPSVAPAGPQNMTPASNPPSALFPTCDPANRTAIPAVSVSTGTVPAGSAWMRNPIPACIDGAGGAFGGKCGKGHGSQPTDYQFPPPGPDQSRPGFLLGGFGYGACGPQDPTAARIARCTPTDVANHVFQWNVVDKVRVPQVPAGEYMISFRWDCEQTPQIWASCSDITITE